MWQENMIRFDRSARWFIPGASEELQLARTVSATPRLYIPRPGAARANCIVFQVAASLQTGP